MNWVSTSFVLYLNTGNSSLWCLFEANYTSRWPLFMFLLTILLGCLSKLALDSLFCSSARSAREGLWSSLHVHKKHRDSRRQRLFVLLYSLAWSERVLCSKGECRQTSKLHCETSLKYSVRDWYLNLRMGILNYHIGETLNLQWRSMCDNNFENAVYRNSLTGIQMVCELARTLKIRLALIPSPHKTNRSQTLSQKSKAQRSLMNELHQYELVFACCNNK